MMIDSHSNLNSRIGGLLLAITLPLLICYMTKSTSENRLFQYGWGMIVYVITAVVLQGFPAIWMSGLVMLVVIYLSILYYGDLLTNRLGSTKSP